MNMQIALRERLWRYVIENRPDLMISLNNRQGMSGFLKEKVEAIMPTAKNLLGLGMEDALAEEYCFNEITKDLRPSHYKYILNNLRKNFPDEYKRYTETGMLLQEIISLIDYTNEVFEVFCINDDHILNPGFEAALQHLIRNYFERK